MSKPVKIGLIVGLLILAIAVVWYFMKGKSGSALGGWTELPGKDIVTPGVDIEVRTSKTVAEDKAYADSINAKSFYRTTWNVTHFKNATGPVTDAYPDSQGNKGTLFTK